MNTILAPTDFSDVSLNAVRYAAELAKLTGSKLILFNAYASPPVAFEIPFVTPTDAALEEYSMDGLKKLEADLQQQFDFGLKIERKCALGFEVDRINEIAETEKPDLIVMGMQGVGFLQEHLVGSTTTAFMRKSCCPVLAIHKNMLFKPIQKIALASDYEELDTDAVLQPLKELANMFNSHVYLLHVTPEFEMDSNLTERIQLNTSLKDLKHSIHSIRMEQGNSVVDEINAFVVKHGIDLVVMMPRHHLLIDNILFEPETKKMAFHAKVPLLSLHAR